MNTIDFKPFIGKNTKTTDYFISITKAYGFGLSSDFCKKNNIINGYDYALLLWDSSQMKLGIKFYKKEDKNKLMQEIIKKKDIKVLEKSKDLLTPNEYKYVKEQIK